MLESASIKDLIQEKIPSDITDVKGLAGGCSYPCFKIETEERPYFVKTNLSEETLVFQYEANGLNELRKHFPNIPQVISYDQKYLILEYIEPTQSADEFWIELGRNLANMHNSQGPGFGYLENNTIGAAEQSNIGNSDAQKNWAEFFWTHRIEFKLKELAEQGRPLIDRAETQTLKAQCFKVLRNHRVTPAPLHGDLWNGNIHCGPNQRAFLIDPAFYFGDPETDIAMTECFGGFGSKFYDSYYETRPKQEGYELRKHWYNLYHMLNHAVIFGDQYRMTSLGIIRNNLL